MFVNYLSVQSVLPATKHQDRFQVVVVCHEKPEIQFSHPNLTIISVDFPLPKHKDRIARGLTDKGRKVLRGLMYARQFAPTHAMFVDADDCVSRRLATFVEHNNQEDGWFIQSGYKYQEGSENIYYKRRKFLSHVWNGFNPSL